MHETTITLEPGGNNLPTDQAAKEIREALGCAPAGVENLGISSQHIGLLPARVSPNFVEIDLSQGLHVTGYLIANTAIKLTGATPNQSGIIYLGVHEDHPGEGFFVETYPDNNLAAQHVADGHTTLSGNSLSFGSVPGAGEYNFGSIAWFYDGHQYFLYVSEVIAYADAITFAS